MLQFRAIMLRALYSCRVAVALLSAGPLAAHPPTPPLIGLEDREILVMLPHISEHFRPGTSYGGGYGDGMSRMAGRRVALRIAHHNGLHLVQNGWPMPLMGVDCYVMVVPVGLSVDAAVAQVSRDPKVVWSQPMAVYRAEGITVLMKSTPS